jgi:hypothetical protein
MSKQWPADFPSFTPDDNTAFMAAPAATGASYGKIMGNFLRQFLINAGMLIRAPAYTPFNISPIGNSLNPTTASVSIQGTTVESNQREFLFQVGLESNVGLGQGNNGDKVAGYFGIQADGSSGDVWAINTVNIVNTYCTSQSIEADTNNVSYNAADDGTHSVHGISVTGASSQQKSGGFWISEFNPMWTRGLRIQAGISRNGIEDACSPTVIKVLSGSTSTALDTFDCGNTSVNTVRMHWGNGLLWQNSAQSQNVIDTVDGGGNRYIGFGSSACFVDGGFLLPRNDNHTALGGPNNRYGSAWIATGAISSSNLNDKTDIRDVPSVLDVVADLRPIQYRWKVGGKVKKTRTEMQDVHATDTVYHDVHTYEVIDGKTHLVTKREPLEVPSYEKDHLHDKEFGPIMHERVVTKMVGGKDGKPVAQPVTGPDGKPVVIRQQKHRQVPRMESKAVEVTYYEDRPGVRNHLGFGAQDVKATMDKHGIEFGGYVEDAETGELGLRYDQWHALEIKAIQELIGRVKELEASVSSLSSKTV